MKQRKFGLARNVILSALPLCCLLAGCKDDDPCDPGQIVKNSQCYPAPAMVGDAGGAEGGADAAAGASGAAVDTPFGTPCTDTTASSDCAGLAPVCADLTPLGQSVMCTQINCASGEANAGVCPSTFNCFAPPGYPSVCIKN
jgi:hypothetical protein